MSRKFLPISHKFIAMPVACILLYFVPSNPAQSNSAPQKTPPSEATAAAAAAAVTVTAALDDKAESILQRAVAAQGGGAYLNVHSVTGRGVYTHFEDGKSGLPSAFLDYLIYPDQERTEFRSQGTRSVQVNVGSSGWVYDGAARTLRDIKPAQIADFQLAMRTSVDSLLRGWWRRESAALSYVGRREAGVGRRNEVVRLKYPSELSVEFEFSATDGLPMKVLYKRKTSQDEEIAEEDRFAQHVTIDGVTIPFVIDHFRNNVQTSRINYQQVELNRSIPNSLFARPADAKALK